jgi:hypothetical protein
VCERGAGEDAGSHDGGHEDTVHVADYFTAGRAPGAAG